MKTTKKIFAVLIAFVLTFSMAIPALAAGTNKIIVTNTVEGEEYKLYKMADLTTDGKVYSYTATADWFAFFKSDAVQQYFHVDSNGFLTAVEGLTDNSDAMREFSKLASAYAEKNNITALDTNVSSKEGSDIPFSRLDDGYYLITSTLGTLAVVESTPKNQEQKIEEKNEGPGLVKEVKEDSSNAFGEKNDAEVGQIVEFKVTITAKAGAKNYVMHDKMQTGLAFKADSVAIDGLEAGKHYTVVTNATDGCTFEIVFTEEYLNTIKADTNIVVTYSAVLTDEALDAAGIENDAKLTYGDKQGTEWDKTTTTTHSINLLKYRGEDADKNPLAGATFELKDKDKNTLKLVKIDDNNYRLATAEDTDTVTSFTTNDLGEIYIKGLDSDTYYLTETQAPEGYNILVKDTQVIVAGDDTTVRVEIANNAGTELPSTGGMGTAILYVAGGVLVVAAVVVFVARRRTATEEA